jgi:putative transcriptional regulator
MNNLITYRKKAGLSQNGLSSASGVTQQQISSLELGSRSADRQSLQACRALVAALNRAGVNCTLDDVFPAKPTTKPKTKHRAAVG